MRHKNRRMHKRAAKTIDTPRYRRSAKDAEKSLRKQKAFDFWKIPQIERFFDRIDQNIDTFSLRQMPMIRAHTP